MANQKSFGRRGNPQCQPSRSMRAIEPVAQTAITEPAGRLVAHPVLEDDLRDWQMARKQNFEIPWRPLSLMATLSFGIASFVLPDSVNDNVQWLLYVLAGASLYAGIRKRRRQAKI